MLFVVLFGLGIPAASQTKIHRCIGDAGEVTFSQVACGASVQAVPARPVQTIGEGLRASERDWLDRIARRDRTSAPSKPVAREPARTDEGRQAFRCAKTRRQLDAVRRERRAGYPAGRGGRLRDREARYEAYLDSFCS
jgi:hypothetical protein